MVFKILYIPVGSFISSIYREVNAIRFPIWIFINNLGSPRFRRFPGKPDGRNPAPRTAIQNYQVRAAKPGEV